MSQKKSAVAPKSEAMADGLGALLFAISLSLAAAVVDAASAPQQWLNQSIQGVDEYLHPVIEDHIRSQLDWRSYYLDRPTASRPQAPSTGNLEAMQPRSVTEASSQSIAGES